MKSFSLGENNNRAIKASAGSGKTFQLAMRFIALLFLEPKLDPAQIVAITFTRKAAAEILNKIIDQLLAIEQKPELLEMYTRQGLLPPELTLSSIPELLQRILESRDLQVSTIDSFFVKIIQAFAPEFGLSGMVEMVDESRDTGEEETISAVIRSEKERLFPLLRDYAQGSDARNFTETLKRFLKENYSIYLLYPDEELWGNLPPEEDDLTDAKRDAIIDTLLIGLEHYDYPTGVQNYIRNIIRAAQEGKLADVKAFPDIEFADGTYHFSYSRKMYLISAEMADGIARLSHYIAVNDLRKKIAKSRAAYTLLKLYDTLYAANVRGAGRLAFRDLPKLLGELGDDQKLDLEYRMDSRNRHYMLDEFQDTSTQQWNFMNNLMAEAIQGTDQSFFMVGDVKQSLYQWRFGNPRLFDTICNDYSLEVRHSDRSFRSAPAVINAVNEIFAYPERHLERDAAPIRRMGFLPHETAKTDLSGYAALMQLSKELDESGRAEEIYKTLATVEPLKRGLSVAILLRTNKEVELYKQALRTLDATLPITTEGVTSPSESMACTFLSLLLRLAAHPADVMALRALPYFSWQNSESFTPPELAEYLVLPASPTWYALSGNLRLLILESGIRGAVARFSAAFGDKLTNFDRERLAIMAAQAEDFTGSVDEYLASLEKAHGAGASVDKTIQIMTIHKSKGLEFDLVFLPELGYSPGAGGSRLAIAPVSGDGALKPEFVSYLPGAFAEKFLPEIAAIHEKLRADALYEKCCGLYVALTRAKRALYMYISDSLSSPGETFRADQLLAQALLDEKPDKNAQVLYSSGKADWFREVEPAQPEVASGAAVPIASLTANRPVTNRWSSPSHREEELAEKPAIPVEMRFETSRAAKLGSRIHAMLECVEYLDNFDQTQVLAQAGNDEITPAALALWEKIANPAGNIAQVLRRPEEPAELWREREFLLKSTRGELLSGCFDRVQVEHDKVGNALSATIYDYKSDALDNPEELLKRHQTQLNAYRTALAQMLNLPENRIECLLLALRLNLVIPVPR